MYQQLVILPLLAALVFDCAGARDHRHDRLRDVELTVTSWSGCAVTGTVNGAPVSLFMETTCVLRNRVPGKFRVRYDQTCGAIVEITDGPRIETPMPPSCPTPTPAPIPTPTPATPTPTPTSVIRGVSVIESDGTLWTLGSRLETLRNGAHAGGGYGSVYKVVNSVVYVLGSDSNWYRWSGGWSWFSKLEPGGATPSPTSTPTPTATPAPSPTPSPVPVPSPVSSPTPAPVPSLSPKPRPCKLWPPWKALNCL